MSDLMIFCIGEFVMGALMLIGFQFVAMFGTEGLWWKALMLFFIIFLFTVMFFWAIMTLLYGGVA